MADNYAKSCKDRFESKGFEPEQPWLERTVISVGEKGEKYSVQVARPNISASFQIDGHAIKDGAKCDKLVIALHGDDRGTTVFVELKGKDIAHAIDQLENTLANNLFRPLPSKKDMVRARIVTGGCGPASAAKSIMERAKIRFRKNYNCDLRILKNGQPDKDAI